MAPDWSSRGFPALKTYMRLNSLNARYEKGEFFDVEFYPFTEPGVDPVFAIVGGPESIVCRPLSNSIEVIAWFRDEDPKLILNSCCWSYDPETEDPLLIVAGSKPVIKIFNVRTRKLVSSIAGHGKAINGLATSPWSPKILASASFDKTVRIWSLDPAHSKQPCMVICGGEGHKEGLQTMAFHPSGRFLLTGGSDNMINCWVIPDLPTKTAGTDHVVTIHYSHFSTMAVHTDPVDCVAWYNDLIISKCAREQKIVLWRIENFNSSETLPDPFPAPTTYEFRSTRSAWGGGFQRLLEFEAPDVSLSWIRFELFPGLNPDKWMSHSAVKHEPGNESGLRTGYHWANWSSRPLLAVGNTKSKVLFWNLQTLENYRPGDDPDGIFHSRGGRPPKRGGMGTNSSRGAGSENRQLRAVREQGFDGGSSLRSTPGTPSASSVRSRDTSTPDTERRGLGRGSSVGRGSGLAHGDSETPATESDSFLNSETGQQHGRLNEHELRGAARYSVRDAFSPLKPHSQATVPRVNFCIRQVAWAPGGEWMVAVGDQGMVALYGR